MSSVCRSSGVLTASEAVSGERSKLVSIHCVRTGAGAATTVRLFDNVFFWLLKPMLSKTFKNCLNAVLYSFK